MKNVTTYNNEEVVMALMQYHRSRMPFNEKKFKAWPSLALDPDSGSWTVLVEEKVQVKVNVFKVAWAKVKEVVV